MTEEDLDTWYSEQDFKTLELLTNYKQYEFDPNDGYQDFIDACDKWWYSLSLDEKKEYYNNYS